MKSFFLSKIEKINVKYKALDKRRQKYVMASIFLIMFFSSFEYLLMQKLDFLRDSEKENIVLLEQNKKLINEKNNIILERASKSDQALQRKEAELKKEIDLLLKNNINTNFTDNSYLQKTLENVINKTNGLSIVYFKNFKVNKDSKDNTLLVRHNFELLVTGGFINIYELISNLEPFQGVVIENLTITKDKNNRLSAKISFYVLNTSSNLIKF